MAFAIEVAVAKTNKYANRESGDTAELVERAGGGFSVVVVDGQGSGQAAKALSLLLTSKAVSLIKEGVRDGAVARAVHDVLFAYRQGRVSASLDILSVDLKTKTVVVTRNGETPMLIGNHEGWALHRSASEPIGRYHFTRPTVTQLTAEPGLRLLTFTDGIIAAGERREGCGFDVHAFAERALPTELGPKDMADRCLTEAVRLDGGRPGDDMTVVALVLRQHNEDPIVRRLHAVIPLP